MQHSGRGCTRSSSVGRCAICPSKPNEGDEQPGSVLGVARAHASETDEKGSGSFCEGCRGPGLRVSWVPHPRGERALQIGRRPPRRPTNLSTCASGWRAAEVPPTRPPSAPPALERGPVLLVLPQHPRQHRRHSLSVDGWMGTTSPSRGHCAPGKSRWRLGRQLISTPRQRRGLTRSSLRPCPTR